MKSIKTHTKKFLLVMPIIRFVLILHFKTFTPTKSPKNKRIYFNSNGTTTIGGININMYAGKT
ncbi:MAG: hypothetical protein RR539_07310 [Clostridium sp.]|uniref:hypothetical protein n=1 Tax=Clostridium sp. TaxID=1506 RepID=UPI002FC8E368